jgi:hypothetical protein
MANVASLSAGRDISPVPAIRALAARLSGRKDELARRVLECWRQEIVDYRAPCDARVLEEARRHADENVDALVASLESGMPVPEEHFDRAREIAARRAHQGIALESFLRAGRVWDRVCWETLLSVARTDVPQEREAALAIAGRIARLADRVATAAMGGFLDEVAGDGLLRHDLLDALLSGRGDADDARRLARKSRLPLAASYVVVVVRGDGVALPATGEGRQGARRTLDRIVHQTRSHLRPAADALLAGMRNGDLVVLFPTTEPSDLDTVREECEALADALGHDVSIGVSGWHEGLAAVATAFDEAMHAVKIADRRPIRGRPVGIDEVLVDSLLDASACAQRILEQTLGLLADYDATRNGALIDTLRAYIGARVSITKSAATLYVHPNTVAYRLRRIRDVCGRDPQDPDDMLVLALALKQADLGPVD